MLSLFFPILIFVGCALVIRGWPRGGLVVQAVGAAIGALLFFSIERWAWTAFCLSLVLVCLVVAAFQRREQ